MGLPLPKIPGDSRNLEEAKQLIDLSDQIYTHIRELEGKLLGQGNNIPDSLDDDNDEQLQYQHTSETIRNMRYQLYILRSEHRRLMNDIAKCLQQFHDSKSRSASIDADNDDDYDYDDDDDINDDMIDLLLDQQQSTQVNQLQPFAKISGILSGSPASIVGLQQHDLVLQFGPVTSENRHEQPSLVDIAQGNLNRPLRIKILRNHRQLRTLFPIPRNGWGGLGALGCHIMPL